MNDTDLRRRTFLQLLASQIPQGAVGAASMAAMSGLSAQTATDSKFLVCLFMRGGNDQSNTIVPTSQAEYAAYAAARPSICLPSSSLVGMAPNNFSGPTLGLHPSLPFVAQLFNEGKAAVVANVGNLIVPTSLAQWNKGKPTVPVPLQLFSHNDQENQWQTASALKQIGTGWLGRAADRLTSLYNGTSPVSMSLAAGRSNLMLTGQNVLPYKITPSGAPKVNALNGVAGSAAGATALRSIYAQSRSNLLESQLSSAYKRSIDLQSVVASAQASSTFSTVFPSTLLGRQLYGVAKMMSAARTLGHKRQSYFVDIEGFDFHESLPTRHADRLKEINDAVKAFYNYLQESGLWSQTVLFTGSDFGRALQSNGKGADHGWGSHHFVIGGAVRGKAVYGKWPSVGLQTADDGGQGRLIPTTALDQYAATLATWFGVSQTDMKYVLPNIDNFASRNLGFLV